MDPVPTRELKPKKKPEARADCRPQPTTWSCAPPYRPVDACSLAKERTCSNAKIHIVNCLSMATFPEQKTHM